jgi:hypothetical protein
MRLRLDDGRYPVGKRAGCRPCPFEPDADPFHPRTVGGDNVTAFGIVLTCLLIVWLALHLGPER